MAPTNSDSKGSTLPYVPFQSFCTALDQLKSSGIPDKIDSSVFPTFSGSVVSHLLLAMRFMRLIDDKGHPQTPLRALVDDKTRKQAVAKLIPEAYAALFQKVDLSKASPSSLDDAIKSQNARGATARKAKAFLIKAAQFAGLQVSGHLLKRSRPSSSSSARVSSATRRTRERENAKTEPAVPISSNGNSSEPQMHAVTAKLPKAGGTLVLSGDFDPFALEGNERDFVYKVADIVRNFGKGKILKIK